MQQCHCIRSRGSASLRRTISLSRSKPRTTSGENGLEFFAVGLGDFWVVRWQQSTNTLKHRNDSATSLDLAPMSLRFDAGLLRNISTELYHVLIMLTTGRAQPLLLKAAEPEGLAAHRHDFRRYEPVSTKLSELTKIGVVIKRSEKGNFRDQLLINTAGTTE